MIDETEHSEPALAIVAPLIFGNQPPRVQKDTQGILEVDAMLCEVARSLRRIPLELHARRLRVSRIAGQPLLAKRCP